MKTWIDWYDFYLRDLPGLTSFAAANELRKAAQEFCRRTGVWRKTMDTMTLTATDIHDFELSSTEKVVKITSAKLNGQTLDPLTREQLDDQNRGITAISATQFQLYPEPASGDTLDLKVTLTPSNTALGVEDFIYDDYAEAIAYGAKARLMRRKDTDYYDPAEAEVNEARFERAISQAHFDAAKGKTRAPLRTRGSFY
jgi:hypothetical protein